MNSNVEFYKTAQKYLNIFLFSGMIFLLCKFQHIFFVK